VAASLCFWAREDASFNDVGVLRELGRSIPVFRGRGFRVHEIGLSNTDRLFGGPVIPAVQVQRLTTLRR
jgi:hypothetical protein